MFYGETRRTVPSSRYGIILDIMEATGWTWDEYLEQPADLIGEMSIRMQKRAAAERRANRRAQHA